MRHVLGALVVLSIAGGRADAQSGNTSALAEQLFNQARDLAKANQWAEACPKFEASLRHDPVLGTRLNLATCYERIGKLASAWGIYRQSIDLAKKAGDTKRADYAQKQALALEPRLPKLAITAPANPPPGLVVKRDDTPVAAAELGVALYADPGAHVVTASAPGFEVATLNVTLVEGKTETLVLPALTAKPADPEPAEQPATAEVDAESDGRPARTRKLVAIGVGAAGLVTVGVGFVFGAKASSSFDEAKALCGEDLRCTSSENFAKDQELVDDARASATLSTVFVAAGVAAVAAGVVVYLTAPRAPERATARLTPVTHEGGAGLAITGTF